MASDTLDDTDKRFAEFEATGLVVETVERVIYKKFVYIFGQKIDAEDLYDTLSEVSCAASSTHMTDESMVRVLKSIGVIESTSGSWGTRANKKRLDAVLLMLKTALKE